MPAYLSLRLQVMPDFGFLDAWQPMPLDSRAPGHSLCLNRASNTLCKLRSSHPYHLQLQVLAVPNTVILNGYPAIA
jgi:hypothetical protein